ncbi:Secretory lipase [Corynebacterium segmentosum]|uniref:Secretory lipase n=2 Tax=Corynebacterium segmentosum TaxID=43990 RepID=A0ABY6TFY6_9CORY|nr:Secretory lipase [Corynebacterium segmentosum]
MTAASPVAGAIDSAESAPPVEEHSELPESSFIDEALKGSGSAEDSQEAKSMAEEASKLPPLSSGLLGPGDHIGDQYTAFYHDPVELDSSEPGQLFRSESVRNPKNPLGISNVGPYKADRILYSSTNRSGEKIQVSGMVIEPKAEWDGEGPRPVVAFAPGTQGLADRCAASRKIADGVGDYEQFYFHQYLKKGYAVVFTDYEGLGTPGMHTYMDRASQGHTVLDSIRAAQQLEGWDINETNPVFINGYSQGGGAAGPTPGKWTHRGLAMLLWSV